MDAISAAIRAQPLYGIVAIAVVLVVTVCTVKRLVKLALVTAVLLGGYLFYLCHTGQQLPRSVSEVKEELQGTVEEVREGVADVSETVERGVRRKVGEVTDRDGGRKLARRLRRALREGVGPQVDAELAK